MTRSKQLFLGILMASALTGYSYTATAGVDDHNHAPGEVHKEGEHSHGAGHTEESHFEIEAPSSVEAAWNLLDQSVIESRAAIEAKDSQALHEAGEKLSAAVSALHSYPQAVKEGNGDKWNSIIGQLSKTADRFHHVAEDNDLAAATETLDLLEGQINLIRSLY